ncbi:MAG TPA: outer membrane beta-barrel protein, partial [Ignavibacteriaceae bacterium]|nr:outer membrane beta-barrel protein [Ignavibacteriaceae bacterium]
MKNLYIPLLLTVLFFSLFSTQANAQITFQIGAGAGYSLPTADYGGTTVDFYKGTKYGMNSGYNFHGKVRLGLLFINAFGEIGYSNFSGEGEIIEGNNNSTVDVSNKVLSLRLGPEFKFDIPLSPITPYFDAFISLNTFNGTVQFKSAP